MSATLLKPPSEPAVPQPARIPRLHNGDRLTADEFERRYAAMPDCRAELVEGVVYMSFPVFFEGHGKEHGLLMGVLWSYKRKTPGVELGDNATARLDIDNQPQPDATLIVDPACGGQTRIDAKGYLNGAPELAAEIAASSASYDLGPKLRAYCRNGVQEYLVWRTEDAVVDWFRLRAGVYEPLPLGADGLLRSEVFPGLWLSPAALLAGDDNAAFDALQLGLATPEHAAFVELLKQRRK